MQHEVVAIAQPIGYTKGLKPSQLKRLEHTFRRRVAPHEVISAELARHLCEISLEINRQVAVVIDRSGRIVWTLVGDAVRIDLPGLGRYKPRAGSFNGLRLIHTHLNGQPLGEDDLAELTLSRFDLVAAIDAGEGLPGRMSLAHLLPQNPENARYRCFEVRDIHQLDMDFLAVIEALEGEFRDKAERGASTSGRDRALIVGVRHGGAGSSEASMAELAELARSAGLEVARSYMQNRPRLDPQYLIGRGKLRELILDSMQLGADLIIFDCALTPAQARSISAQADVEVLDRNQLILANFGQRARTRAGALQVELASLRYELPRLHERAEGLSRITGGIGARGPGETKLEIHRRRVRDRITHLERQLEQIKTQRQARRKRRQNRQTPIVSVIGYTNSGKSTLFNRLTASAVLAEDRMFATLDPTSRRVRFDSWREFVLTDTVGFIRDLPDELVQAFEATLEELADASLLIHLVDASNPDHDRQVESVEKILEQLALDEIPVLLVYNKIDILERQGIEPALDEHGPLPVSAADGRGVAELLGRVAEFLWPGCAPRHEEDEIEHVTD